MQIAMIGSLGSFHGEGSLVVLNRTFEIITGVHDTSYSVSVAMSDDVDTDCVVKTLAVRIMLANAVVVIEKCGEIHFAIYKHGMGVKFFVLSSTGIVETALPPDEAEDNGNKN